MMLVLIVILASMPLITPETIARKTVEQVNEALFANSTYLSAEEFQIRRLFWEVDKLIKVDPYQAYIIKSLVHSLTGDYAEGLASLKNAERLYDGSSPGEVDYMRAQLSAKLGYFSEGLNYFKKSANLEQGYFSSRAATGDTVGAFSFVLSQFQKADRLGVSVQANLDLGRLLYINQLMIEHALTDEKIASFMDVAGRVARSRGIILKEQVMDIQKDGDDSLLRIFLEVDCLTRDRVDMLFELAEGFAELPEMPSGFHIAFKEVLR